MAERLPTSTPRDAVAPAAAGRAPSGLPRTETLAGFLERQAWGVTLDKLAALVALAGHHREELLDLPVGELLQLRAGKQCRTAEELRAEALALVESVDPGEAITTTWLLRRLGVRRPTARGLLDGFVSEGLLVRSGKPSCPQYHRTPSG
jgi:phosphate uptake regulator